MRTFLSLILVLALAVGAVAQDEPPSSRELFDAMTSDEVGARASHLLADIQTAVVAIDRYRGQLATASREDSLVLRLQIFAERERGMVDVHELADALLELEETGEQAELRDRVITAYDLITPAVWELIGDLRGEVDELRARRGATAPADRSALEDRVNRVTERLDATYEMGGVHVEKLAVLEQDTTATAATFRRLLEERADELSGRLKLDLVRAGELAQRLKDTPDDGDATALSIAVQKSIARNTASQTTALDLMDTTGLATENYRAQLVTITQDFSAGLLDAGVTVSLATRAWEGLTTWIAESGPKLLVKLLMFLAILFIGRLLARVVRRAVQKGLSRETVKLSQLLKHMIVSSSYNVVMALALMVGLSQLGISLGPLLAGFGVVGFILGFAMQDSLSNLAAGMMILINRPYDVGDLVEVAGAFGKVEKMSLVSTGILTLDNQKLVVPNSKIWGDIIKNVTDQSVRRVDMVFGISYSDDIPKAEALLNEILASNDRVLDEPEHMVRVHALGESSVDFVVRPWVKTDDYWEVHWDVTKAVKMRFDEEGISIPFPQRDVHIFEEKVVRHEAVAGDGPAPTRKTDWEQETAPEPPAEDDA